MNIEYIITRVSDQITYNIHYAPMFTEEDLTNIERERTLIESDLNKLSEQLQSDVQREWVASAHREVVSAFREYENKDEDKARNHLEFALDYLTNAKKGKPRKADFVAGPGGIVTPSDNPED
jgi:hypothetical protein